MIEQSRLKLIGLVGFPGNVEDLKNRTAGLVCVYTRAVINGCKIKAQITLYPLTCNQCSIHSESDRVDTGSELAEMDTRDNPKRVQGKRNDNFHSFFSLEKKQDKIVLNT